MSRARIAINGFGRIGRCLTRQLYKNSTFELVAVNDRYPINQYLLASDSVYGIFDASVQLEEKIKIASKRQIKEVFLHIDKHIVAVYQGDEPVAMPWAALDVDIVVDATGSFTTIKEISDHLEAGAKNVIITYPPKSKEIKTIVMGVNEEKYESPKTSEDINSKVISAGSSSTLALAPILKYLDAQYGITHAHVLVSHAYTDSQNLLDNSSKDLWRCRASTLNIVPTPAAAEENVPAVLPTLEGKITCMANRTPMASGSQLFIVADLSKDTTAKEVNEYFATLSTSARNLLDVCTAPAYSSYFRGNAHNAVIDPAWTSVHGKTLRVVAWFDNEWGYTTGLVALMEYIAKKNKKWF